VRGKAGFATEWKACWKSRICCVFVVEEQLMAKDLPHCRCPNRSSPTLLALFFCWLVSVLAENCAFELWGVVCLLQKRVFLLCFLYGGEDCDWWVFAIVENN
jgi:hypothetical protein